jgi:hypothetical protein
MELANREVIIDEITNGNCHTGVLELVELELALIGGGIGDVVAA